MGPSKDRSPVWEHAPAPVDEIVDTVVSKVGLRVIQTTHSNASSTRLYDLIKFLSASEPQLPQKKDHNTDHYFALHRPLEMLIC